MFEEVCVSQLFTAFHLIAILFHLLGHERREHCCGLLVCIHIHVSTAAVRTAVDPPVDTAVVSKKISDAWIYEHCTAVQQYSAACTHDALYSSVQTVVPCTLYPHRPSAQWFSCKVINLGKTKTDR